LLKLKGLAFFGSAILSSTTGALAHCPRTTRHGLDTTLKPCRQREAERERERERERELERGKQAPLGCARVCHNYFEIER
jgi:hypothetical protein